MFCAARSGRPGPFVLARDVVEHEVEDQADPRFPQARGQRSEIGDGAQIRADGAVVGDRVAAVAVTLAGEQQRHQVQIGDPELLQVRDPAGDAGEITGEPLGVGRIAQHLRPLQPVLGDRAHLVEVEQFRFALGVGSGREADQAQREPRGPVEVDLLESLDQVGPPPLQPDREGLAPVRGERGQDVVGSREGLDQQRAHPRHHRATGRVGNTGPTGPILTDSPAEAPCRRGRAGCGRGRAGCGRGRGGVPAEAAAGCRPGRTAAG